MGKLWQKSIIFILVHFIAFTPKHKPCRAIKLFHKSKLAHKQQYHLPYEIFWQQSIMHYHGYRVYFAYWVDSISSYSNIKKQLRLLVKDTLTLNIYSDMSQSAKFYCLRKHMRSCCFINKTWFHTVLGER